MTSGVSKSGFLISTVKHADAGQLLVVCHQGDAVACQILLEQVDLINGQRDDLAVHVGADQNHRAGQVVLAAHLQHLRRIVAEQQRGVREVQAGIVLLKAGQDAGSLVQRDDGQLHVRGNGCEVDLAAPIFYIENHKLCLWKNRAVALKR